MLIVDAHEDLAYNMLTFQRDYTRPVAETRRAEAGANIPKYNDDSVLGWPEYQRGHVAIIFSTLFAVPERLRSGAWDTLTYATAEEAHRAYHAQIDLYKRLVDEHPDKFRLILNRGDLQETLEAWMRFDQMHSLATKNDEGKPPAPATQGPAVGLVILMEGAEGVRRPDELEQWQQRGVRLIGPAWGGTRFCGGTREPGPMTPEGFALLEGMAECGFILDISHMDEKAALQALDVYPGQIVASHSNALALLKGIEGNRHLPDLVLYKLLQRGGMVGIVPFNGFLKAGWRKGDRREEVGLSHIIAQIDYICQMAGNAQQVGIGSDFDGGFGLQSIPTGIDTIADLQTLIPLLAEKGYSENDISAILGQNWLGQLQRNLPEKG